MRSTYLFQCPGHLQSVHSSLICLKIALPVVVKTFFYQVVAQQLCGIAARKRIGQSWLEWIPPSELSSRFDQAEYSRVFIKSVGALKIMTLWYIEIYYI